MDEQQVIAELSAIIATAKPSYLPRPGPQAAWRSDTDVPGILTRAEYAVRDLLDLGATAEVLNDLARGVAFGAISASLKILADDQEGELAGELYNCIDELPFR